MFNICLLGWNWRYCYDTVAIWLFFGDEITGDSLLPDNKDSNILFTGTVWQPKSISVHKNLWSGKFSIFITLLICFSTQVVEGVGLLNREVAFGGAEVRIFSGALSVWGLIPLFQAC